MVEDDESKKAGEGTQADDRTRRAVEEANRQLAKLHRERTLIQLGPCLDSYDKHERAKPPTLDANLVRLLADEDAIGDFADNESSDQLIDVAESFTRQLRLYRKTLRNEYDVFLCHNARDRREVQTISRQLQRFGLLSWLDEQVIRPGERWVSCLQEDIERVRTCAVVVGDEGVGPWQEQELNTAIQLFVERGLPLIPVILPGCTKTPDMPPFLRTFHRVDYRSLDPDPIEQLVWAITGRPPVA